MKTFFGAILLAACLLLSSAFATQESKPQPQLVQFYVGILEKGPKWTAMKPSDTSPVHEQHVAYVTSLLESGRAVVAGPLTDESELRGVYIFRTQSADDAKAWAENDPAVLAGHLIVEMHPWWSQDVFKKPDSPIKLSGVYFGLLSRGPKWTADQTPEIQELQKAHLANTRRLAEMKKLVVAGPFGDKGKLAGIFVFRTDSLQEAQTLAATDPMVKAGRWVIDLHPWMVPEGALP